ncbi:SMP-30/gluconolactonase/LRE family protein (plasmid) [Paenibacillus rhizovicinus]|uniref:Regucalcin n=1 Tax=Paenibacillus rhizovicinus TaxID=2704463 RepID=A0A6C0PAY4_9BACL|nr:SMP-30/gluconolactonase/LRE family protein [Paenibacillus rhizovicinus]QHW35531.1 SMP-30/gluconolactonase/LRE family protein [Paenibacillus rhizovicinus]
MGKAELVLDVKAMLAEGPNWDAENSILQWVDIPAGRIHWYNPSDGSDKYHEIGQFLGAAVQDTRGKMILAAQHGFYRYDPDSRLLEPLADPESHMPSNRFNDGKCDRKGRFWAGTMHMNGDSPTGALYCLHPDLRMSKLLTGVSCSNGITWSPDQRLMYYIDSPTRQIAAFDFDVETGTITNSRTVVEIPSDEGIPDGMTSDMEGNLWVAQWGGWRVSCWNPSTGKRLAVIDVPAALVSSCTFGGSGLDELYITTARMGLDGEQLRKQPGAGGLYRYKAGVRGMPSNRFGD